MRWLVGLKMAVAARLTDLAPRPISGPWKRLLRDCRNSAQLVCPTLTHAQIVNCANHVSNLLRRPPPVATRSATQVIQPHHRISRRYI